MNTVILFFTFSTVLALIFGLPADEKENSLDLPSIEEECSKAENEETKKACEGKFVSNAELKSALNSNLKKIGVDNKGKLRRRTTKKHNKDDDHIDDFIKVLETLKTQTKNAYIGAVKEADKLKKKITPDQKEMLEIYMKQLKIANDFTQKKIDQCIKELQKEEKGGGSGWGSSNSYSSGGGVIDTVNPAIVNFGRQYDSVFEYMSEF